MGCSEWQSCLQGYQIEKNLNYNAFIVTNSKTKFKLRMKTYYHENIIKRLSL